ncbi:MAG TPA: hypothetical protein VHU44_05060 [Acidobacteriaceae bacterium]|jgi:hypothetical protein|nr:hypothetical protein [Acidobacteriaceae bacterium]
MNRNKAILLAVIQIALVLSIAGKYLYERKTCPRVWVRTAQFDPNMPMRGRYLALQLSVDACGLPQEGSNQRQFIEGADRRFQGYREWRVKPVARKGKLLPVLATDGDRPEYTQTLTEWGQVSCDRAVLSESVEYFIADSARTPFPLQPGQELWVEVTVPPMGPPRPIQLATSKDGVFTPLKLD